jgi:hypothetical protein
MNKNCLQILIIGCTGRSLALPEGRLRDALHDCREARIMLLDPREHGAIALTRGITDPGISPEVFREEIRSSIVFIKGLRSSQKIVRLKLYPDMPLFKLAIFGDCATMSHYPRGLNIRSMHEFVFQNKEMQGGMYLALQRYFLSRWQDPDIPEYDFETDELVYHDQLGYEVLREPFDGIAPDLDGDQRTKEGPDSRYVFR